MIASPPRTQLKQIEKTLEFPSSVGWGPDPILGFLRSVGLDQYYNGFVTGLGALDLEDLRVV